MLEFTPHKIQAETEIYGFNFKDLLPAGVTVSGSAWTVTVLSGVDASPAAILSGAPSVSGSIVSQAITAGVVDVKYCIQCKATTTNASVSPILSASLWIRQPCWGQ